MTLSTEQERRCGKPAIAVYVWPSMEKIPVCDDHAHQANRIASAMGFRLGMLEAREGETCTQRK